MLRSIASVSLVLLAVACGGSNPPAKQPGPYVGGPGAGGPGAGPVAGPGPVGPPPASSGQTEIRKRPDGTCVRYDHPQCPPVGTCDPSVPVPIQCPPGY